MGDLIRFVDTISASPTLRLDLNDETSWWTKTFDAPPPRLRRSMSSNAMRDGFNVGSATYDGRTLTLELECRKATQDLAATELQKLARELDRPGNWLQYQPNGLTKPVFFRTFRSDTSQLADVMAQQAMRTFTVELLAEPFALGLRETLGSYTMNNDPAAGSNGLYFDVTGVLGDVAARPMMWWTSSTGGLWLTSSHGTSAIPAAISQAESMSLTNDTANPGGGPDAAMSGAGTNNYARTSFATTATMATRISATMIPPGSWRALVAVRRSSATGVINVKAQTSSGATPVDLPTVATELTTSRRVVDLGIVSNSSATLVGDGMAANSVNSTSLRVQAERVSGTSTIDWDYVALLPAGGQVNEVAWPETAILSATNIAPVLDASTETIANWSGGDPSQGTSTFLSNVDPALVSGGFPSLQPGVVNRVHMVHQTNSVHTKSTSLTVNVAYWPRYLFVRPVSS